MARSRADRRPGEPDAVQLRNGYKRLLLQTRPAGGGGADYKVIVVVVTDLPADRAPGVFDDVLRHLAVRSYADDGILFGPYCEGNEQTAIHNSRFWPFRSPVPFLFVRPGVIGDWEFFSDDEEWLGLWARRYGESAVRALAEELRRTNWRQLDGVGGCAGLVGQGVLEAGEDFRLVGAQRGAAADQPPEPWCGFG